MGNLLILNFGTFAETNRFKARALRNHFVDTDLMYANPPGALVRRGGLREIRNRGGTSTYSFYGLRPGVWRRRLGQRRRFYEEFRRWMTRILNSRVHCVYLTGHHSGRIMWGEPADGLELIMRNVRRLRFQVGRRRADINPANLRSNCYLVLGFGCNIGNARHSAHYQRYFHNGAQRPVVLGWNATIAVPRANWISVNNRFFDYVDNLVNTQRGAPGNNRLAWLYQHHPLELLRAWGHAVLGYRGHRSQARLWRNARARHSNGRNYRFRFRNGVAQPVRA